MNEPCFTAPTTPPIFKILNADGTWTDWSEWSECSVTCGAGNMIRSRECEYPSSLYGGADCVGNSFDKTRCNKSPCPGK